MNKFSKEVISIAKKYRIKKKSELIKLQKEFIKYEKRRGNENMNYPAGMTWNIKKSKKRNDGRETIISIIFKGQVYSNRIIWCKKITKKQFEDAMYSECDSITKTIGATLGVRGYGCYVKLED